MIRIVLPAQLCALANVRREIALEVGDPATLSIVLDALEDQLPMLRGTIRDQITKQRRPFIRFYACGEDLSQDPQTNRLPEQVISGEEPLRVVGSMAGG